jgi:hypothetical protein
MDHAADYCSRYEANSMKEGNAREIHNKVRVSHEWGQHVLPHPVDCRCATPAS